MTDQRSDAPEPALGLSLGQDPETQERFLRLLLRLARRPGGAGLGRGSDRAGARCGDRQHDRADDGPGGDREGRVAESWAPWWSPAAPMIRGRDKERGPAPAS